MEYNVFYHDPNKKQITTFNIFRHGGFREDIYEHLRTYDDKTEFAEKVERSLLYYFWCKSEYEILIRAWCGGNGDEEKKIDIYSQVMLNFDKFVDYVWSNKRNASFDE